MNRRSFLTCGAAALCAYPVIDARVGQILREERRPRKPRYRVRADGSLEHASDDGWVPALSPSEGEGA